MAEKTELEQKYPDMNIDPRIVAAYSNADDWFGRMRIECLCNDVRQALEIADSPETKTPDYQMYLGRKERPDLPYVYGVAISNLARFVTEMRRSELDIDEAASRFEYAGTKDLAENKNWFKIIKKEISPWFSLKD
jgi:hypothetical protein